MTITEVAMQPFNMTKEDLEIMIARMSIKIFAMYVYADTQDSHIMLVLARKSA